MGPSDAGQAAAAYAAPERRPSLSAHVILVRYVAFSTASGVVNLTSQELVVRALPALPLMVSVIAGTGVGFVMKYLLDKRWIFLDRHDGHAAELRKLVFYAFFGVLTTLMFWALELGFWRLWGTVDAKYLGAVLGLTLGGWIKYLLDKHYVFSRRDP